MKNRRNVLIAFLLCATLIVGVGYASVVDILDVDGTFEYFQTHHGLDADVKFTDALAYNAGSDTSNDIAALVESDNDKVIFKVKSLADGDDKAYFRFKVENTNAEKAVYIFLRNYSTSAVMNSEVVDSTPLVVHYTWNTSTYDLKNFDHQSFFNDYANWSTATPGETTDHAHEVTDSMYLYIAVTWENSEIPAGLEDLTADFAFEFGVEDDSTKFPEHE